MNVLKPTNEVVTLLLNEKNNSTMTSDEIVAKISEIIENYADSKFKYLNIPVVVCSCCGKNAPEICGSCVSDIAQGTAEQAIDCR